jgi:hypothetical protein
MVCVGDSLDLNVLVQALLVRLETSVYYQHYSSNNRREVLRYSSFGHFVN